MHLGRPQSKTKKAASRIELAAPSNKSKGLYKSNKRNHIIPQTSESVSIRLPGGYLPGQLQASAHLAGAGGFALIFVSSA
jgi:hypothetical protein